ncbi:MAG: long-chain fatty acid--CoA ligase, partial [Actinomycetales bacterium]|nr:long-chain fatty acid--CoA ligase [Actinomycetales bacterium]
MDEISVPLAVEVDPSRNLNHLLADRVAAKGDETLMEHKLDPDGPWVAVTAREFDARVVAVAKGLVAKGVEPGQSVGIMSRTRFEWSLLDWAVWAAGAV